MGNNSYEIKEGERALTTRSKFISYSQIDMVKLPLM